MAPDKKGPLKCNLMAKQGQHDGKQADQKGLMRQINQQGMTPDP